MRALAFAAIALSAAMPIVASVGQRRSAGPSIKSDIRFNRDVRPILSDHCVACHGPDKNKRQANLRLDLREEAVRLKTIVPGQPEKSKLVQRIEATGPLQMPPDSFHKPLSPAQKSMLKRWIAQGAAYEGHWSFSPVRRTAIPAVQAKNWVRNPIDNFVLAPLESLKVSPSPEADRRTLIRRVSLDLVGLPPTPEEAQAFVKDSSPKAYDALVDRLLASPHFGERMATPWLDSVRYADTVGFHGDQNMNSWAYRDWVIHAFNSNMPFDQFTIEQIAGDLLPNPTHAQRTATCFNRLNMVTREGGAQPKEYLAKYAADRVRTVGMAWMGLTTGCAECHDHKFDPFTARDFYSLAAFFADVKQWGVYSDYSYTPNKDLVGFTNDHNFPPEIHVESPFLKKRIDRLQSKQMEVASAANLDPAKVNAWAAETNEFLRANPTGWATIAMPVALPAGMRERGDGTFVRMDGKRAAINIAFKPAVSRVSAIRLELVPTGSPESVLIPGQKSHTLTISAKVRSGSGAEKPINFRYASANLFDPRYSNGFARIGVQGGWVIGAKQLSSNLNAVYLVDSPVAVGPNEQVVIDLPSSLVQAIRFSYSPLVPLNPDSVQLPTTIKSASDPTTRLAYMLSGGVQSAELRLLKEIETEIASCRKGITPVLVTEAVTPTITRIFPRGNWQDESGPVVTASTPAFLTKSAPTARQTRMDLARWLVAPDNPLTSRVFVNRLWRQFFGTGLSASIEDFGAQGEPPSHPELLDWLAAEFKEKGWDVKRMVRLIVSSAAYRQSSKLREELRNRDPNNRLIASQSPRRLEAEFIRDNALRASGLLQPELGGPPVKPYQPPGYYAALQFPDRDYVADRTDNQYRRGVYSHWQRTFLHPMLANFDASGREEAACTRTNANTPQQALTLLNDPSFVEAARVLAGSLLKQKMAAPQAIESIYLRALTRLPRPEERDSLLRFLEVVRNAYRERPDDAAKLLKVGYSPNPEGLDPIELATWTSVCRVVLNLHETITRY